MLKTRLLLSLTPILISACCQKSPETDFCQLAHPIYLDKTDRLTQDTKREVLSHFETGHVLCGWPYAK